MVAERSVCDLTDPAPRREQLAQAMQKKERASRKRKATMLAAKKRKMEKLKASVLSTSK